MRYFFGFMLMTALLVPTANVAANDNADLQKKFSEWRAGIEEWRENMVHPTNRWMADRTINLQTSWMNGTGMLVWENRFGAWDRWSPRDRSILGSMVTVQRRYVGIFSGEGWTPLVAHQGDDVFTSLWEGDGFTAPTKRTLRYSEGNMPDGMAVIDAGDSVRVEFDLNGGGRPAKFHWKTPRAQELALSPYAMDIKHPTLD